jgi:2-polyprenyl-3-methyl-5-hydroxy-6-metoxy-1,4-benzoquinol methylase
LEGWFACFLLHPEVQSAAMKEPFLEPILRRMRLQKVLPVIRRYPDCRLLDVGCGWDYRLLKTVEPLINSGVGIDLKVQETTGTKINTVCMRLTGSLPFDSESFDVVTMLAVLEHLSNPAGMMVEIERVLKKGGRLVLTVPSKLSKPVLEFLAFRLKIVSAVQIKDHKTYYNAVDIRSLLEQMGLIVEQHRYFQIGMNNYCVAIKPS